MKSKHSLPALTLLVLLGIVWGSGYALARYAISQGVPFLGYAFWQAAGPALLLVCYVLCRRQAQGLRLRQGLFFLLLGSVGILIPNSNMYFIAPHLPAGLLAVVVNTVPLFTYIIALCLREERFVWLRLSALLLMVCGLGLVIFFQHTGIEFHSNHWVLQALISPLCFAFTAVIIAKYPQQLTPIVLAAGMMLVATVLLTPLVLGMHQFYTPTTHWQGRDWAILVEIVLSSIGYIIFFELLSLAGAVYYSFVGGVVAIMGLLWGQVFFHDHYNSIVLAGISLIIIAIVLENSTKRKKPAN